PVAPPAGPDADDRRAHRATGRNDSVITPRPSWVSTSTVRIQSPGIENPKPSARYRPGPTSAADAMTGTMPACVRSPGTPTVAPDTASPPSRTRTVTTPPPTRGSVPSTAGVSPVADAPPAEAPAAPPPGLQAARARSARTRARVGRSLRTSSGDLMPSRWYQRSRRRRVRGGPGLEQGSRRQRRGTRRPPARPRPTRPALPSRLARRARLEPAELPQVADDAGLERSGQRVWTGEPPAVAGVREVAELDEDGGRARVGGVAVAPVVEAVVLHHVSRHVAVVVRQARAAKHGPVEVQLEEQLVRVARRDEVRRLVAAALLVRVRVDVHRQQ